MNYYSETIFNLVWNLENILKKDPNYSISKDDVKILERVPVMLNNIIKQLKEKNNIDL